MLKAKKFDIQLTSSSSSSISIRAKELPPPTKLSIFRVGPAEEFHQSQIKVASVPSLSWEEMGGERSQLDFMLLTTEVLDGMKTVTLGIQIEMLEICCR